MRLSLRLCACYNERKERTENFDEIILGNLYLEDRERDGIALIRNLGRESASWLELAEYYVH